MTIHKITRHVPTVRVANEIVKSARLGDFVRCARMVGCEIDKLHCNYDSLIEEVNDIRHELMRIECYRAHPSTVLKTEQQALPEVEKVIDEECPPVVRAVGNELTINVKLSSEPRN